MLTRTAVICTLIGLAIAGISGQIQVGEAVGPLSLEDQYEHAFQLSDLRGSVAVLIDGDRTGSDFNGVWGKAVRSRYKNSGDQRVAIVYIAHLTSVPGFMKGFVRKKFLGKDSAHPAGRIFLDWQGVVAARLGFVADISNVYVVDREGILRHRGSGKGVNTDLDPLFRVIDEIFAR